MQLSQAVMNSPFAILTAVVAPAVLTNACSVMALGISNRVARVVDRTRAVTAELHGVDDAPGLRSHLEHQLAILRRRGNLLVKSLRFTYLALAGFSSSALVAVVGGALSHFEVAPASRAAALVGLVIGLISVAGLVLACVLMVRETTMAIENLDEEAELYSVIRQRHEGKER